MSAARLLYSSRDPKAPLDSTTDPNTSYSASRLRYSLNVAERSSGEFRSCVITSGSAVFRFRDKASTFDCACRLLLESVFHLSMRKRARSTCADWAVCST